MAASGTSRPIQLISTYEKGRDLLHRILSFEWKEMAVDLEGDNLGENGKLSLITIMGEDKKIYVIDVVGNGSELIARDAEFKEILESRNIIKSLDRAVEACRSKIPSKNTVPLGIVKLCEKYGIEFQEKELKEQMKERMSGTRKGKGKPDTSFTLHRPLTREFVRYAASDVRHLLELKAAMIQNINEEGFSEEDQKSIMKTWYELKEESLYKWIKDPKRTQALKAQRNRRDRTELRQYVTRTESPKLSRKDKELLSPRKWGPRGAKKATPSPTRRSPRLHTAPQGMDIDPGPSNGGAASSGRVHRGSVEDPAQSMDTDTT